MMGVTFTETDAPDAPAVAKPRGDWSFLPDLFAFALLLAFFAALIVVSAWVAGGWIHAQTVACGP